MQKFPTAALDQIKQHLEHEKKRITTRMAELTGQDPFSDPNRSNDNAASDTEASEESDHDRVSALVSELAAELDQVSRAIARIEEGMYGYCSECGTMIDTDRLAILPTATLCLTHEKAQTKKLV